MSIYDISVAIASDETPVYPGDPGIEITSWSAIARGDAANVSLLHFGAHTATHVDAPAHFFQGAPQVSTLPLDVLIGEARVVELANDVRAIDAGHVAAQIPAGTTRVLFKTRNSAFWSAERNHFRRDFTYIAHDAAHALVERGMQLVGLDYLSVEKFEPDTYETHTTLLSNRVIIIEGLNLSAVGAGTFELICLPLKVASGAGDGAPARVVLRTLD